MAIFGAHVEGEAMEEISQDLDEMEAGNARNLFFWSQIRQRCF